MQKDKLFRVQIVIYSTILSHNPEYDDVFIMIDTADHAQQAVESLFSDIVVIDVFDESEKLDSYLLNTLKQSGGLN